MSKKVMIGIDGVARKVKKGYIGINGVAHKIKKAYVGINGVARPFWSGGIPVYNGKITALPNTSSGVASKVGQYALYIYDTTITAYDQSLTQSVITHRRTAAQSGHVGEYAFVPGGAGGAVSDNMDAYDSSLTRLNAPNASYTKAYLDQLPNNKKYFIYPGGYANVNGWKWITNVDAYDTNLIRYTPAAQSTSRGWLVRGGTTDKYAMIVGGAYHTTIDVYDTDLTHSVTNMKTPRRDGQSCPIGNYLLIPGGMINSNEERTNTVEVCDQDLTCTYIDPLSSARWTGSASLGGDYVICAGGDRNVDIYDAKLTHTIGTSLTISREYFPMGNDIGDFVLFAGNGTSGDVETFTLK